MNARRRGLGSASAWLVAGLALILAFAPSPTGQAQQTPRQSLTGKLLVASPDMHDPRFRHGVILMIEHDAGGALGLMVNRPMGDVPWSRLLERLHMEPEGIEGQVTVHYGGPVDPGRGFLVHSDDVTLEESQPVTDGIALTIQTEMLRALAAGEGPEQSLFVLGYAGWSAGQLEAEMRRDDWFTIPVDPELVFAENPEETWEEARARQRIEL